MMEAVLFDLDGVLIDSRDAWYSLLCAAAHEFGHSRLPRRAFDESFGQGVEADGAQFFPGTPTQALLAYFDAHFLDHARHVIVNPDAVPLLNALADRGIRHAVVTNTASALARATIRGAALEPDEIIGTSDAAEKPDPAMLLLACERLAVQPERALMVGDSRFDREAAAAAGIRFIGFGIDGDLRIETLRELLQLPEVAGDVSSVPARSQPSRRRPPPILGASRCRGRHTGPIASSSRGGQEGFTAQPAGVPKTAVRRYAPSGESCTGRSFSPHRRGSKQP